MGKKWPKHFDLSTLRILGTVGEPIDVETWNWYFDYIGNKRCFFQRILIFSQNNTPGVAESRFIGIVGNESGDISQI